MKAPSALRRSLAHRLTLIYGLTSVLVVAALGLGVYLLTERYIVSQMEDELEALAVFYAAYTSGIAPDQDALSALAPEIVGFFAPQAGYDVRIFQAQTGALISATQDLGQLPSSAALSELGHRRSGFFLAGSQDLPGRLYAAQQVTAGDGSALAAVEVSRDLGQMESLLSSLRLVLAVASGLALVVAWIASLAVARHVTRPLQQMERVTQAIAAGDFGRRLGTQREDEVGRLARSINHMTAELAHLETARRDFIARISHDLRTPLTAIKGLVVNLQDTAPDPMQPSLTIIEEQTDRLVRLVDDLLTVSRAQRGELRLDCVAIDLRLVARSAVALAGEKAKRLGVALSLKPTQRRDPIFADADRLQQATLNLLDNALKATEAGGAVVVSVSGNQDVASLTVVDDGRGLSDEEAARAFEPYVRGPEGGAGLGLTIAREIVKAHGGRIWLKSRPEGGTEAGFALPILQDAEEKNLRT